MLDFLGGKGGMRIDTHASMVFLGENRVLKIKRAVRLPFLDYSTLEKRKAACEEELRVNVVNAPELYRRVVPITCGNDGVLEIGGTGAPIEWAVEMARFDGGADARSHRRHEDPSNRNSRLSLRTPSSRSHDKAPRADGERWTCLGRFDHRPQHREIPGGARTSGRGHRSARMPLATIV